MSAIVPEEVVDSAAIASASTKRRSLWALAIRNPSVIFGGVILLIMLAIAILAPVLGTVDPTRIDPASRNKKPGTELTIRLEDGKTMKRVALMGTDSLGRDVYSRVLYGTRVSLIVGVSVAIVAVSFGLVIGLVSGYIRWLDGFIMRIMDGLMAIPDILLAIAMMALFRASVSNVVIAVTIPQVPRVVRLVRAVVLTIRERPYIEAAHSIGTRFRRVLTKHLLPNTIAPLIVQATYTGAAAVLTEAGLSFLGAGTPPNIPSWGNMMAEGRTFFQIAVWIILFPGMFLAVTVLAVNLLGDGLRDALDPRLRRRM